MRVIALATSGLVGSAPSTTTSCRIERGPAFDEDVDVDTRLLRVDLRRYGRTRLQKPRPPETDLDLIETVGERAALITHARHDPQGFAHLRLGKPTGALEVDSPDHVRLPFAHHDAHGRSPVPDLGLLDVDLRRRAGLRRDTPVRSTARRTAGSIQAVIVPTASAASRSREVAMCVLPVNSTRDATTGPGSISIVSVLVPLAASAVNAVAIVAWR